MNDLLYLLSFINKFNRCEDKKKCLTGMKVQGEVNF